MAINVYLDESGDLGWKFDNPYRHGGSSRFLTIAFIVCPPEKKHLIKRIVKGVYTTNRFNRKNEVKGSSLSIDIKKTIAQKTKQLLDSNLDISLGSITVRKTNVQVHIRQDANKLYNYMLRLSILDKIDNYDTVNLIRDNKTIKVKSGNSLIDYLQTVLWFDHNSRTTIIDIPSDSKSVDNLIFIDWINNIVWSHFEDNNHDPFNILTLNRRQDHKTLFF